MSAADKKQLRSALSTGVAGAGGGASGGTNPSPVDRRRKDEVACAELMKRLNDSGEKERLKQALRAKLIESGWRDEMKDLAKEVIRSRGGVTKITVDELVSELLPRGRAAVPETVKNDLLSDVRDFARKDGLR